MKRKGVLAAFLMLIFISSFFITGNASLTVGKTKNIDFEDNLIPENPQLPQLLNTSNGLVIDIEDNLIPENPGQPQVLDQNYTPSQQKILNEYLRKKAACKKIKDEDKRERCIYEANMWFAYKMEVDSCKVRFKHDAEKRQQCIDKAKRDYERCLESHKGCPWAG